MKFEVIGPKGKVKLITWDANCVYDFLTLKRKEALGYTFRLNKKVATADIVNNYLRPKSITKFGKVDTRDIYEVRIVTCTRVRNIQSGISESVKVFDTFIDAEYYLKQKVAKIDKNYYVSGVITLFKKGEVALEIAREW